MKLVTKGLFAALVLVLASCGQGNKQADAPAAPAEDTTERKSFRSSPRPVLKLSAMTLRCSLRCAVTNSSASISIRTPSRSVDTSELTDAGIIGHFVMPTLFTRREVDEQLLGLLEWR